MKYKSEFMKECDNEDMNCLVEDSILIAYYKKECKYDILQ